MKPQRLKLTHNLLVSYGVYRKLEVYVSPISRLIVTVVCITRVAKLAVRWVLFESSTHYADRLPAAAARCLPRGAHCIPFR